MKTKTVASLVVLAGALAGCASITPADWLWPVATNPALDEYNGHPAPSIKIERLGGLSFTSLAIAKIQKKEAEWKHYKDELFYVTGMKLSDHIIAPAERAQKSAGNALMAIGAGSPLLSVAAYLFASGKKDEAHKKAVEVAGNMDPEEFKRNA